MGLFEKIGGKSKKGKQGLAEQRANRRRQRTLFYRYSKVSARSTFVCNKRAVKVDFAKQEYRDIVNPRNRFAESKAGRTASAISSFKTRLCSPPGKRRGRSNP